jgi:hypothetical protein
MLASQRKNAIKFSQRTSIAVKVQNDRQATAAERRGYPPAMNLLTADIKENVGVAKVRSEQLQTKGVCGFW